VSRRQRDEAFKRGDYGAPDAEGRQKRPYDKFSHSSGARRKQEKKGGHGAGNWGEKGKVSEDAPAPAEDEEKKEEGEEVKEKEEGAEGDNQGEDAEAKEEYDDIDYEAFLEKKKKEDEELSKLVEVEVRQVDDAEFEGMKPLAKGNDDVEQLFPQKGGKKNKKKGNQKNDSGVAVDKVLDVQAPRQDNRRGNKGRQGGRPQRSNNKRNVNLTLDDDNDFPSLGGK
jgi:hypothetical protein